MAYACDSSAATTAGCSGAIAGPRSAASRAAVANSHSCVQTEALLTMLF